MTAQAQNQSSSSANIRPMRILLAYDGSQHARAAVDLLLDLHLPPETEVLVVAVMPDQYITGHELLGAALDWAGEKIRANGLQVKNQLIAGNPAATINECAYEFKTDFTLIGARGLRATLGILLGGVAQQVIEYSCCPALVVRAPYRSFKRVLVVTDGSIYSQKAIEYLAGAGAAAERGRFPLPEKAEIQVLHVLPPKIPPDLAWRAYTIGPEVLYPAPAQFIDIPAVEAEEEIAGQLLLDEAVAAFAKSGIQAGKILRRGDAATEIIEYVKQNDIDLVVSGSRGLSQVSGWLLGSVSRKIVHYASSSVLIVKQPKQ